MKRKLMVTFLMLLSFAAIAQEKASIKIKSANKNMHYYNLPRILPVAGSFDINAIASS